MLFAMVGAVTPTGGGGDWWTFLGPFIPAAMLGLAVIGYLVRKLDQAQTENKALSERVISTTETMVPLLTAATTVIEKHQDVLAEATTALAETRVELRRAREGRDGDRSR